MPLYIEKLEIWSGVTDALTDSQTFKDRVTQLLVSIYILIRESGKQSSILVDQKPQNVKNEHK